MPQLTATAVTAISTKISQEGKKRAAENGCKPGTVALIKILRNHQAAKNVTKGHGLKPKYELRYVIFIHRCGRQGHERLSGKQDIGNLVVMTDFLE
jgi:hypothetical protein